MLKRLLLSLIFSLSIAGMSVLAQSSANEMVDVRTEVYSVAPTKNGDMELMADLYQPLERPIKGAVVLIHGGGFTGGHRELKENQIYGKSLAQRGYLAAAISYRLHKDAPLVKGWAKDYSQMVRELSNPWLVEAVKQYGPGFTDAVASAGVDLIAAVNWLKDQAEALGYDPDHIALFGASAGGITALTTTYALENYGAENLDVRSVINLRGNWLLQGNSGNPFDKGEPPLLMLHGIEDKRVPLTNAEEVFRMAGNAGVRVEFYTASNFGHELGGHEVLNLKVGPEKAVLDRIDEFLQSSFKKGSGPTSLRSRLFSANYQFEFNNQLVEETTPDESLYRSDLRSAVDSLIRQVRKENDFIPSLYGISKEKMLLRTFDDFARKDWSYWPRKRVGLSLRHMTAAQRKQTHRILSMLLSSKGYLQANHIMMLEEILKDMETSGFARGVEGYMITLFGKPSSKAPWGIRFEGHHLSLNITLTPDGISVTPSFLGASPAPLTKGIRAGFNPLKYEQSYALALLKSLSESQRDAAILSEKPLDEILTTQFQVNSNKWVDWQNRLTKDGIVASAFNKRQKRLMRLILTEIVGTYRDEISREYLNSMDLDLLTFAWMGETELGKPHYFRIQGKDFVFELDAAQEDGKHVHTVWRDRHRDFGGNTLIDHYKRQKH